MRFARQCCLSIVPVFTELAMLCQYISTQHVLGTAWPRTAISDSTNSTDYLDYREDTKWVLIPLPFIFSLHALKLQRF